MASRSRPPTGASPANPILLGPVRPPSGNLGTPTLFGRPAERVKRPFARSQETPLMGLWIFMPTVRKNLGATWVLAPLTIPAAELSVPVLRLGCQLLPRGPARYRAHTPLVG